LPATPAASCTRVVRSLHRPQPLSRLDNPQQRASQPPRTALPPPPHPKPTPTGMDPDQVAAAGVQHDDFGDTTTSADGGGYGEGSSDSWGRALVRRGWDLSKKAAIAGVAATAAPVLAPSLLVLSVAGLALSLPFAAYLASLAGTDRLMGALLPPPRAQAYHTYDCNLEDDEFLDASEALGGEAGPMFDYWRETEDDAIMEENESYASLPLSREPRLAEEPVPAWHDEEDTMSVGESRFQELGHEPFVLDNRAQKEDDNEYITMEPVQELSESDNGDKTEDGKHTATEEMDSSKEMVSLGINIDTIEVSDFPVPDDNTLQSKIEGDVAVEMVPEEVNSNTILVTEEVVGVQMDAIATELPECEPLHSSDLVAQESRAMAEAAYADDILESILTADIVLDIGDRNTEGVERNGEGGVSSVVSVTTVGDVADQSNREDEVTVEMVLEEVQSTTDLVTGEVVGVQVDIITSGTESLPLSDLVGQELQGVTEATIVDDVQGSTVTGGIVKDIDDTNTKGVERHSEGGACSFISGASAVTMDDADDVMSSESTPYVSAISEATMNVEGRPDAEHPHETTGFEYKPRNEGLTRKVVAEDKDDYTEDQLREQLDTLRTITGYRPATSLTLEAELAGLYVFVGVEPPVSSRDTSDLTEINVKLRFLKSIIGVE
ncbi:hypothetical protein BAE44_0013433, partial [Dichanthelium oligosanthes]